MVLALGDTFRAVLMLVMASSLGMLPMALGRGLGSEMRAGIGTASFGGVLVSGILTMLVLPLIYTLFTKKKQE
jgi:HAE1 family hydrophobic/amphiphilic exporter-1